MPESVDEVLREHRARMQEIGNRELSHINTVATLNARLLYLTAAGRIPQKLQDATEEAILEGESLTSPLESGNGGS